MDRRVRLLALLALAAGLAVLVVLLMPRADRGVDAPPPRDPLLPDLVTLPLFDFLVGTDPETGAERLRFSATIANVGAGPLRIEATRGNGSDPDWQVLQWFDEPDGEPSAVDTGANLVFGGHGHDHWHLRFGAVYQLSEGDGEGDAGAATVATSTKAGYCFFDQIRLEPEIPAAPATGSFGADGCGDQGSTDVSMGLSVGWSDPYYWQLEDQSVEVTGLPDGVYRLSAVADPDGWLRESDDTNNGTFVDLRLGTTADGLRTVEEVGD